MNKYLLPLALASCTPEYELECPTEVARLEEACDNTSVIGKNDNRELIEAINATKRCVGEDLRIICHNDGWSNFVTYEKRKTRATR